MSEFKLCKTGHNQHLFDSRRTYHDCKEDVTIGDIVELDIEYDYTQGIVLFIGEVNDLKHKRDLYLGNIFYEIQLFNDKERIFVQRNKIERIIHFNFDNPRVTIDDVIFIKKYNCTGIIRYIGTPTFTQHEQESIRYGIELKDQKGENNGTIDHQCYFSYCKPDFGVFMNRQDLDSFHKLSNDSLLIHGFLRQTFIADDIVQIIKSFYHIICLKNCDKTHDSNIVKRYNFTDLSNNMIGPIIKTEEEENFVSKTEFDGLYSFEKWMFYAQVRKMNKATGEWEIIYRTSIYNSSLSTSNYWGSYFAMSPTILTIEKRSISSIMQEIASMYRLSSHQLRNALMERQIDLHVI